MTVKALIVPADVTEVDSPDPVSHGAVAVNVPTAADAPARTLPTVQTGARGAEFLAAHDTPAATVNVTGGWPIPRLALDRKMDRTMTGLSTV